MDNKEKDKEILDTVIEISEQNLIQTHGEGASQIIQAYKGTRIDSNGNEIVHKGKDLKTISQYKVSQQGQKDGYSSYKQQSGFSGELIKEARDNQKAILENSDITTRTTDGIGQTNNQLHDHIKVDEKGNIVDTSGSQMKMCGRYSTQEEIKKSSEALVEKMVKNKKWEKYKDSPMDIPSEQVDIARKYALDKSKKLNESAKKHRDTGNIEKANKLEADAKEYKNAGERIRDSHVSSKEAMYARKNPEKFVVNEVINSCHKSGIECMKSTFIITGAISSAQNIYEIVANDKSVDDAIKDIAHDTGESALTGYIIGAGGSALKSVLHSSKNGVLRNIGKSNAPAMIATGVIEVGKSVHRYANGDIDETQLVEELGEKGTGIIAASYGAMIGASIVPFIGGFIGGMIGYTVSSLLYNECLNSLKHPTILKQRRLLLEQMCHEAEVGMANYKREFIVNSKMNFDRREYVFENILSLLNDSISSKNIDGIFTGINSLGREFNVDLQFSTFDEFDEFMNDENSIFTF